MLALKGNQETLAAEVEEAFIDADARDYVDMETDFFETVERGHGRVETRRYRTLTDLSGVSRHPLWKGMNMIGMVESAREVNGKCSTETRYFIASIGTGCPHLCRCRAQALGDREQTALGARRVLSRGRLPRPRHPLPARTSRCCATSP